MINKERNLGKFVHQLWVSNGKKLNEVNET